MIYQKIYVYFQRNIFLHFLEYFFQSRSKVPLNLAADDLRKSSRCLGAELLLKLLGNYCRNRDIRTSINVGVVGEYLKYGYYMSILARF